MDDTTSDDDKLVEPAEVDLKKSTHLNDADEIDELPPDDEDPLLVDPLLLDVESLDELADKEDEEEDGFGDDDEW